MKRKNILTITAALSIASVMSITAFAAYTAQDVCNLQDVLFNRSEPVAEQDLNNDGIVNGYDLGLMKKQMFADTGELKESSYAATEQFVKLMGRHLVQDGTTWLLQSGSAAEFTVTGTTASVTLAGDNGRTSDVNYRPRYGVYVDGELITDTTIAEEEITIPLFDGSVSRTAKVKVMLLSEAMYGGIGVKSVDVTSSAAVPVVPAPKGEYCIEFIGDSITCAYGVEGTSSSDSFKTTTENFSKSYAYLAAQQLGFDYSAVSYSGHGIVSGYSSGDKNTESLVPDYYTLVSKYWEYNTHEWDFTKRENDVVVINLGTNDINYVTAEPETRGAEFTEGYVNFLKQIRGCNPHAYIICTLGTMGGEDLYPYIEEAVAQRKADGDMEIMCYASVVQNGNADGYGSDWHPSAVTQQNSAYVMADKICQALGIESSQIGLDMAVDAEYSIYKNTDGGANASDFLAYDKSYHINTVTGGSAPGDIEALLSGIELRAGAEYRIEFEYTSGNPCDMPVCVRSSQTPSITYFEDIIPASSSREKYSATFTVDAADPSAQIAFGLGGVDYNNVSLYNIKLVKTK